MDEFDHLTHETERKLRDLRRLASGMVIPTAEQEALLERLVVLLREASEVTDRLRAQFLDEAAPPEPERPGNR